jgi:hypothetical protein
MSNGTFESLEALRVRYYPFKSDGCEHFFSAPIFLGNKNNEGTKTTERKRRPAQKVLTPFLLFWCFFGVFEALAQDLAERKGLYA